MENQLSQTSNLRTRKTCNSNQSKKGFKIQISSFESFTPLTLSVHFRKSNSCFKVSLRHNQSFRENTNHSFNVEPKVIQLIPN
jgi:hypothetical protein